MASIKLKKEKTQTKIDCSRLARKQSWFEMPYYKYFIFFKSNLQIYQIYIANSS